MDSLFSKLIELRVKYSLVFMIMIKNLIKGYKYPTLFLLHCLVDDKTHRPPVKSAPVIHLRNHASPANISIKSTSPQTINHKWRKVIPITVIVLTINQRRCSIFLFFRHHRTHSPV